MLVLELTQYVYGIVLNKILYCLPVYCGYLTEGQRHMLPQVLHRANSRRFILSITITSVCWQRWLNIIFFLSQLLPSILSPVHNTRKFDHITLVLRDLHWPPEHQVQARHDGIQMPALAPIYLVDDCHEEFCGRRPTHLEQSASCPSNCDALASGIRSTSQDPPV